MNHYLKVEAQIINKVNCLLKRNIMKKLKSKDSWTSFNKATSKIERNSVKDLAEFGDLTNFDKYIDQYGIGETKPCPFGFDNPDNVKEATKTIEAVAFNCNVKVKLSLETVPHLHTHYKSSDSEANEKKCCHIHLNLSEQTESSSDKTTFLDNTNEPYKELLKNDLFTSDATTVKEYRDTFNKLSKFLEDNLAKEIDRIAKKLIYEFHYLNQQTEIREDLIKEILEEEEKEIRKRLPVSKGRISIQKRTDFKIVRNDFLRKCINALLELDEKKMRLNKNQLAQKMFRGENPLLSLNRKLKDYQLSFDEISQKYLERKLRSMNNNNT